MWKLGEINYETLDANLPEGFTGENGIYTTSKGNKFLVKSNGEISDTKIANAVTIGDYVNYTYDKAEAYSLSPEDSGYEEEQSIEQTEGLKWRVLNINEDGSVDLISETPTSQTVTLKGAEGYNNGVTVLNDICKKQYSNKELGIEARSIKIEDIENQLNDSVEYRKNSYKYGEKISSTNANYPNLFAEEIGSGIGTSEIKIEGLDKSEEPANRITGSNLTENITAIQSYYGLGKTNAPNYLKTEVAYDLLYNFDNQYYIASRCINRVSQERLDFCLWLGGLSSANGHLLRSDGSEACRQYYIRTIVTLDSAFQVIDGDGSISDNWVISK